jgi:hypothetical protein
MLPGRRAYLEGLIDVPFLNVTPGTRSGIIHDERYAALCEALGPLEEHLNALIAEQQRAEEEQASQQLMRAIQRAFREALLALPPEEYDWFDVHARSGRRGEARRSGENGKALGALPEDQVLGAAEPEPAAEPQRQFFEHAGPLFSVVVSPAASTIAVNASRYFKALPRDRSRRRVTDDLQFRWEIIEGGGTLASEHDQEISFQAPATPGLVRLRATVRQRDVTCSAEALITVTDSLAPSTGSGVIDARGLPGYTFERASGELWRSRFDATRHVIVVNNGHRDFVFASRTQALKLRYLVRLYVKELVLRNFSGVPGDQLLERMIELSLYTEDKL